MLSGKLKESAEKGLAESLNKPVSIISSSSISGGCINHAVKIKTTLGEYFLKHNNASLYPHMFSAEEKGLRLLRDADEIFIPMPICSGEDGTDSFLILDFVQAGIQKKDFWEAFGISLARLHQHTADKFGLDHNNYIGSLPQSNKQNLSWVDFFICERLEPQIKKAKLGKGMHEKFTRLFGLLPNIFPKEPPALLHGDLWNGNYMVGEDGKPVIIDPAVYYGHREMDVGMTMLFGGFDKMFYDSYNQECPLEQGWESRLDICNLYPLLVHVNLFGGGYIGQVNSILDRFAVVG
ncbi:MAG TPA: ketosamine-3-kinase [Flavobacteriales bacterium]|nr:ketosamine-3-kinase [Flavobacteriales bacterium]